jgi:hypothetical protein
MGDADTRKEMKTHKGQKLRCPQTRPCFPMKKYQVRVFHGMQQGLDKFGRTKTQITSRVPQVAVLHHPQAIAPKEIV